MFFFLFCFFYVFVSSEASCADSHIYPLVVFASFFAVTLTLKGVFWTALHINELWVCNAYYSVVVDFPGSFHKYLLFSPGAGKTKEIRQAHMTSYSGSV